jgi:hypothetical protein
MRRLIATHLIPLAAAGIVVCAATGLAAEPITLHANNAGELAELCGANPREPGADARLNFCDGFAQGAVDVELHYARDKRPFCFPQPAPNRRTTLREFASWVQANPDRRSMSAPPALFRFLGERFPCRS